ncbi:YeeE/YedE family protein [Sporobolomyces koalae]|uniref:YeeE/YedE family protein n=1 Tax=Sporobolomyces koalae TaxID=500713 RepID=UPI0031712979
MQHLPAPLVGAMLLSYASSTLLLDQGRIFGCSGIVHSVVNRCCKSKRSRLAAGTKEDDVSWKVAATIGLVLGGVAVAQLQGPLEALIGQPVLDPASPNMLRLALAGLTVGAGTKLARGCTSGHMLIGLARFSIRSLVAVTIFFPTAILTSRLFPSFLSRPSSQVAFIDFTQITMPILALFFVPLAASLSAYRLLSRSLAHLVQSFSVAVLFSVGLALTGMLRPSKVVAFFDFPIPSLFNSSSAADVQSWDPSLAWVAIGGVLPNIAAWRYLMKPRKTPRKRDRWDVPTGGRVEWRLVVGSVLFGIGWGLSGICPGPMLAVLGTGSGGAGLGLFVSTFLIGGYLVG